MWRLQEHGRARYPFSRGDDLSYYLRMLTDRGERILWGRDLECAIAQSTTRPKSGDLIGVSLITRKRDVQGSIINQHDLPAHRNRWVVEKIKFFAERAQLARRVRDVQQDARRAVRSGPELASTYLSLRSAQELAEQRIADPKERERFVALVREAIAGSIQKGEPLPVVRMHEASRSRRHAPAPTRDDEPTR